MDNPWRTLSSKVVYENPWIRVREDRVIRPDGREGIYGVVSPRGIAVKVVAIDQDERVHLVRQYRYPTGFASWEIPGGAAEGDEAPLEAARRELREEAGMKARAFEQLGGRIQTNNSILDETGFLFLARELSDGGGPEPDPEEAFEQRVVPFTEALSMVERGEIEDVMTVIGILRAARRLGR